MGLYQVLSSSRTYVHTRPRCAGRVFNLNSFITPLISSCQTAALRFISLLLVSALKNSQSLNVFLISSCKFFFIFYSLSPFYGHSRVTIVSFMICARHFDREYICLVCIAYKNILYEQFELVVQRNVAILHDVMSPQGISAPRLSYLCNTNRPLWPFLMIGSVDGLRRMIVFVTLETRFSLTCIRKRGYHCLGSRR